MARSSCSSVRAALALGVAILTGCAGTAPAPDKAELRDQVMATERAFARTMATRDFAAFTTFLSDEAVFFGASKVMRGKEQVAAAWKPFYEKPQAPFSWEPATVEVLASGHLALSSGPVHDPSGREVATFTSIWRRDAPGVWRIVFDKGNDTCVPCEKKP